ncbi:MAG: TetR/AcrR family transcriptional regulator [Desulfatibacillum sp.]|nr:TetR/AcrR family transcriptional regulator [Desulfatibacillum sp.]
MKKTAIESETPAESYKNSREARKEATRQRILEAARSVFVRHPFQSASLRMIGDAAGVKHPLIIHYFGSKTSLFERIAQDLEAEVLSNLPHLVQVIEGRGPGESFMLFLRLMLEYSFRRPDAFKAIMLNVGETSNLKIALPGLGRMAEIRRKILNLLSKDVFGVSFQGSDDMFFFVYILCIANFVGASEFHAKALGLPHESPEYRQWTGDMFEFLFMPAMEAIAKGNPPPVSSLIKECSKKDSMFDRVYLWKTEAMELERSQKANKREAARSMILEAARHVFSQNPYDTASIRMIGKQGKFDHTLIRHYFPTKADLFEAAAEDVFNEFIQAARMWGFGLEGRPFPQALTIYLDRTLTYCFQHREALGILMHNMAHAEQFVDLDGFAYVARLHPQIYDMVLSLLPVDAPDRDLRMWLYTLITVLYTFAGAPEYPARLLGMDPTSESYRQWVLKTLISIFLSVFSKKS